MQKILLKTMMAIAHSVKRAALLGMMCLLGMTVHAQVSVSAQADGWTSKVSPLLCQQVVKQQVAASRAASGEPTETYVGALVKLAEGQNGGVLRCEGTLLLDSLDGIYIALLPASRIPAMASGELVVAMEAHEGGKINMDVTHVTTGADKVQAGSTVGDKTIPAYTGKGVVVGISDGGFDYTHPMFFDAQGNLRIKKAWDVFATNSNGYGGLGAIYSTQEELLAAKGSKDFSGTHGTHVMGIAAGSPWKAKAYGDKEVTYRGLAYEADIVSVTAGISTGIEAIDKLLSEKVEKMISDNNTKEMMAQKMHPNNIMDVLSMKVAFDYAQEHNMPCVVNCSWSSFLGYADRTTLVDEFVSKLTGPGRILVCSAGNDGNMHVYAEKPADAYEWSPNITLYGAVSTFQIHSDDEFEMDVNLYKNGDGQPYVEFTTLDKPVKSAQVRTEYNENPQTSFISWTWKNKEGKEEYIYLRYGYVKGITSGYDYKFDLEIPKEYFDDKLFEGITLTFRSKSGFKMIGSPGKMLLGEKNIYYNPYTVGWPGSHPQAITVGLMSHRNRVTNIAGQSTFFTANYSEEGLLVNWSSCGPTLDGRTKPEVTAPGYNIVSARSKLYSGNTDLWNYDNDYVVARGTYNGEEREVLMLSGTSMSAPVMTGIVALWLQAKPTLTREEIISTLSRTCKRPTDGKYPNDGYGYGEVDAYAGLLDILGVTTAIPTLSQKLAGVTLQGRTLRIEGITEPTTVNVYSLSGKKVFSTQTADGIVNLPNLPAAVYAVQCGSLGSSLIRM